MIKASEPESSQDAIGNSASDVKKREWLLFLFLIFVLAPALAIVLVGGYGFLIWMYQTIAGPPGPPAR